MIYDPHNPLHVQERSWIGDAVLALIAREWIMADGDHPFAERSEIYRNLTSNHFLSALGHPAKIEAEIGNAYLDGGLEAARAFFHDRLLPLYRKQELNRQKQARARTARRAASK
jgi:dsRNA-specific ribonuclease